MKKSIAKALSVGIAIGFVVGFAGVTAGAANAASCSRHDAPQTLNSLIVAELNKQKVASPTARDIGTATA